ncbi:MAG: hypothetical protein QXM68_04305 [Candidatus Aenigmatarchaeota archaeon]|nr:hypothetical protein [Candidatus Aenigmarchaeota archaeon]
MDASRIIQVSSVDAVAAEMYRNKINEVSFQDGCVKINYDEKDGIVDVYVFGKLNPGYYRLKNTEKGCVLVEVLI